MYVERRDKIAAGAALDTAGKRAAFAWFFGPLHFLTVYGVADALGLGTIPLGDIADLGCGTGVGGAALALAAGGKATVSGVDENRWVIEEARWTFLQLGVQGRARQQDLATTKLPGAGAAIVAAYAINELAPSAQTTLLPSLIGAAKRGARVLVVEPIAKRDRPYWDAWQQAFVDAGGRYDEWRLPADLPPRLRLLDKAAGLRHDVLKARSLYLPGDTP